MRTTTRAAFAIVGLMLLMACGSDDGEPTLADGAGSDDDGASSVTASGADSQIIEEGDQRPEDEVDGASVVRVVVELPPDIDLAGNVIVALEDITYSDTEAVEIARLELPVAQLIEQGNQVEMFLPLPLDGSVDVTATVHLDVDENGTFSQGDWISPELAMVTPETSSNVIVNLVQI